MLEDAMLDHLRSIVGPRHLLTDPDLVGPAGVDWTGRFRGAADAVVRPADAREVAAIVELCRSGGVAIYSQGGNTGLVGGSVPEQPGVVLSTIRMDQIGAVDHGQLTAAAGATLAAVHRAARQHGWDYPIDLGARDSATIGGTVATNAGGLRVLRHGMTRRHVVGLECVTGAGEVLRDLRGLAKDNTGYHLPSLLTGSEGTLAIVTRVRLALTRPAEDRAVALLPVGSSVEAVALADRLADEPDVCAVEYLRRDGCLLVAESTGQSFPHLEWPASLLVEVQGPVGAAERLATVLERLSDSAHLADAAIGVDPRSRRNLWAWREGHTDALARLGTIHKLDVSIPRRNLATFLDRVDDGIAAACPAARVWVFGHLGDGNIHVNVSGLEAGDHTADRVVFDLVSELDGSISAEHGIGRAKRDELYRNRSPEELAVFARIKAAFDPDHILNPGILLPT